MHILVCDDDAAFSAKVAEYAATYFEAHEIPVQATVCSDPEQVLAIPDLELYRIAFLDVDMPQVNGIALGGQLRHRNPDICLVYVSAYLAFALDGYKVNAYRYILKRDVAKQLPSCLEDIYASMMQAGTKTLTVHHNRATIRIPLDQIYYLESEGRVINVYGDIAREHFCTFYGKLKELPPILAQNGFLQVGRSDVVITTGGLGPTDDDLTKETIASVAGAPLKIHEDSLRRLESYFKGRPAMGENQRKQAMLPEGATVFPNDIGTAPGCGVRTASGKVIVMLPGPPSELVPMLQHYVVPFLKEGSHAVIHSCMIRTFGLGEGAGALKIADLTDAANPTAATYAKENEMFVRVTARRDLPPVRGCGLRRGCGQSGKRGRPAAQ